MGGTWNISTLPGHADKNEYILVKLPDPAPSGMGNVIEFFEDGRLESRYTAPCGNDCFPASKGTYVILNENHVRLHLIEVSQRGICDGCEKKRDQDLGIFEIELIEKEKKLSAKPCVWSEKSMNK